jgi:hypothetical protein
MLVNQTQKPVELEGYMANKFDFGSLDLSMCVFPGGLKLLEHLKLGFVKTLRSVQNDYFLK